MPVSDYQEALNQCFRFIDHGQENREKRKQPEIMSWAQDFDLYIAPINRIAGCEVRALEYLHWYSFLSYYQEIGDCLYAQVVSIRDKKARGKSLDKQERDFYRRNRDIVDLKTTYSEAEADPACRMGSRDKKQPPRLRGGSRKNLFFILENDFATPEAWRESNLDLTPILRRFISDDTFHFLPGGNRAVKLRLVGTHHRGEAEAGCIAINVAFE